MDTKRLRIDMDDDGNHEVLQTVADCIDGGGLVAFPTETVYGLACRVEPAALARLDAVKGRTPEKHYTLHIGSREQLDVYVPHLCLKARKLVSQAWPGPLTLIFDTPAKSLAVQRQSLDEAVFEHLYGNGSLGVRWPNHPVAQELLSRCQHPVVAPSANRTGQAPAVSAAEVQAALIGEIDYLLDGGDCPLQVSSTVARVGPRGTQILREGAYSAAGIERYARVQILFVCTGNTCRSAMAEALGQVLLAEKLGCDVDELGAMGYKIRSVGTMNVAGMPASQGAMDACIERDIDLRGHRSHGLSLALIEESDLILVMEQSHRDAVLASFPEAAEKCFLVSPDGDIPDPIGQPLDVFRQCADRIEGAIVRRLKECIL